MCIQKISGLLSAMKEACFVFRSVTSSASVTRKEASTSLSLTKSDFAQPDKERLRLA